MTQEVYNKATSIQGDLRELQIMVDVIYLNSDITNNLVIKSPRLKQWLKECITKKISELKSEFIEL